MDIAFFTPMVDSSYSRLRIPLEQRNELPRFDSGDSRWVKLPGGVHVVEVAWDNPAFDLFLRYKELDADDYAYSEIITIKPGQQKTKTIVIPPAGGLITLWASRTPLTSDYPTEKSRYAGLVIYTGENDD